MQNPEKIYTQHSWGRITKKCTADQVIFATAEDKLVQIFYVDDIGMVESLWCSEMSLVQMMKLHGEQFLQIHRAYIVNTKYLLSVDVNPSNPSDICALVHEYPVSLPVSRRKRKAAQEAIKKAAACLNNN